MIMTTTPLKFVGLVTLLLLFFMSGIHKIANYHSTVVGLTSKAPYIPFPHLAIAIVIALELLGPIIIPTSVIVPSLQGLAYILTVSLLAFVIVVTAIYHPPRLSKVFTDNLAFYKNTSLFGGLVIALQTL